MKKQVTLALVAALTAPAFVMAQDAHHGHGAVIKTSSATAALADGEVKKVDKDAGKMTIKHGPIENLGMSNMTMVFRVKDPAMLDKVKPGDKIRFAAEKVNGALTVTKIDAAK